MLSLEKCLQTKMIVVILLNEYNEPIQLLKEMWCKGNE
jgi:hypothetical protein